MSTTNEQGATSMHLPPSIEGRNPLVGGGDAVRAARFAWLLASPGIGREENQQLRDGSFLPARTLHAGIRRREGARFGGVPPQSDQHFPGPSACAFGAQPALSATTFKSNARILSADPPH